MNALHCFLDLQKCGGLITGNESGATIMLPLLPLMVLLASMVVGIWKDDLKGYLTQNRHVLILVTALIGVYIVFRSNFGTMLPLVGLAIWELSANFKKGSFLRVKRAKVMGSVGIVCLLLAGLGLDYQLKARIKSQLENENNNLYVNFLLPPTSRSIGVLLGQSSTTIDEVSYQVHRQLLKSFEEAFHVTEVIAVYPSYQEMGSLQDYQNFNARFGAKGRSFHKNLLEYFSSTSRWADYLLDSYIGIQAQDSGTTITFSLMRFDIRQKRHIRTPVLEFELGGSLNTQDIDRMAMVALLKISAYVFDELPFSVEQKNRVVENLAVSYKRFLKQNREKFAGTNISLEFAQQWQSGNTECAGKCMDLLAKKLSETKFTPVDTSAYRKKMKTAKAVILNLKD